MIETPKETSFYEYLAPLFASHANAINIFHGRIQVDVLHNEFIDICGGIRFDIYPKEHGCVTEVEDVEMHLKKIPDDFRPDPYEQCVDFFVDVCFLLRKGFQRLHRRRSSSISYVMILQ